MSWMVVTQRITDYAKWKTYFDAGTRERRAAGIRWGYVMQSTKNPDEIVVMLQVDEAQKALAFTQSDRYREILEESGVEGEPKVTVLETLQEVEG